MIDSWAVAGAPRETIDGRMTLATALGVLRTAASGPAFRVLLASGFTPLHLRTFLAAHLRRAGTGHAPELLVGDFGDLLGTLQRAATQAVHAVAAIIEWSDLDARLDLRRAGRWSEKDRDELPAAVGAALARLDRALAVLVRRSPVAIALPATPLSPVGPTPSSEASGVALALHATLAAWAAEQQRHGMRVLDTPSAVEDALDVRALLEFGFPYRLPFAERRARGLARLVLPPPPLKGLITDLDHTLWHGILGEDGEDGVSWSLEAHSQVHAWYQQTVASLADAGVLVGVASKNEPALVERALARPDLLVPADRLFPVRAGWGPKSESVREILAAWNIGARDAVFVDDSAMELEEVARAHPDITVLRMPPVDDPAAVLRLCRTLRDCFGKARVSVEDRLRTDSLRAAAAMAEAREGGEADLDFLRGLEGVMEVQPAPAPANQRPFELVNKTNQFNLNGRRYTEAEWRSLRESPGAFVWGLSYADKFGPLGMIAVVAGRATDDAVEVDAWVMSCRAFARRIEHHTSELLREHARGRPIRLDFQATGRNQPLVSFVREVSGVEPADGSIELRLRDPAAWAAKLPHRVRRTAEPGD